MLGTHQHAHMLMRATSEYRAHLRQLEHHLDGWRPCPPTDALKEYEEMTFLKYLRQEQKWRFRMNKCMRQRDEGSDGSDDSDY